MVEHKIKTREVGTGCPSVSSLQPADRLLQWAFTSALIRTMVRHSNFKSISITIARGSGIGLAAYAYFRTLTSVIGPADVSIMDVLQMRIGAAKSFVANNGVCCPGPSPCRRHTSSSYQHIVT